MKKIILLMAVTLLALYIVLSILGSGGEYGAEKLFYRALKLNSVIARNPDVAPPKLLSDVENTLKKILVKYPKTNVAMTANMTLAEFYIRHKRYDDALSKLDAIIKAYDKNQSMLSTAHFLKGRVYERQGYWQKALKEYAIVRDNYTETELGLQVPLVIAKYYVDNGRDADAKQAYNDAVTFYGGLEKKNHKKMLGYIASKLLIQTYMFMEDYEKASSVIEETIYNYPSQMTLMQLLPQMEILIVKKLKQPERAVGIYKKIREMSKDEKLNKFLDKKIEELVHKKVS